jgi:hypothetical protein
MCLDVLLYCNVYITNLYTYYFFTYNVRKIYKIHIIKTEGKLYDSEGKLYDSEGKLYDSEGKLYDSEGKLYDSEGKLYDFEGKLYDSEGKLIFTIYVNINVHDQSTFTFNRKPLK